MIRDAGSIADGTTLDAVVAIVGAGPAGITLALELDRAGVPVRLLEAGGLRHERRVQALLAGEVVGGYAPLRESRLAALGGSTQVWSGWCRRLDPLDFAARPWIAPVGWPFPRTALEEAYRRAHALLGVDDADDDPATWERRSGATRLAASSPDVATAIFRQSEVRFGERWRDALAQAAGIDTILHAAVLRLRPAPASARIDGVDVAGADGRRFAVRARVVVLAAGGIENARLLLLSGGSSGQPIGNARGLVGRHFIEHLFVEPGRFVPAAAGGPPGLYDSIAATGGAARGALALAEAVLIRERLPNAAFVLMPAHLAGATAADPSVQALYQLWDKLRGRAVPGGELALGARVARAPGSMVAAVRRRALARSAAGGARRVRVLAEQAVQDEHRVTLGATVDRFGRPLARVHWDVTERDLDGVRRSWCLLDQALRRAGAGGLALDIADDPAGWRGATAIGKHPMGATRMHPDPSLGVTDANARVHGTANLFVAGSSLFPAGGYANPTLTIVALAIRLAEHLRRCL